ncbi:MAG: methionyl-tRNA formyltransferase, partial [Pyrinomonadaceae bacterium]|nr:methionyl-tRNA formyltransferase [Pyrinomonadaceae bacterium]
GNKLHAPPVKEFAVSEGLTVHQPAKIKTQETLNLFKSHEAEIAVVVAYGRILPQTLLETPAKGCVNVHFSLLPKYRGAAPVNWAIVNGETETGVTTMKMDIGLDTGDMLLQRAADITPTETAPELMEKLSHLGAELLSESLRDFDKLTAKPQNHEAATHAPIMKRDDGLIDWNMNATEISNRVRGFQPFPNAFTTYESKKLVIWNAQTVANLTSLVETGTILQTKNGELLISCGNHTTLSVTEVQLEGKKRMKVRDFLNGTKLNVGEKF